MGQLLHDLGPLVIGDALEVEDEAGEVATLSLLPLVDASPLFVPLGLGGPLLGNFLILVCPGRVPADDLNLSDGGSCRLLGAVVEHLLLGRRWLSIRLLPLHAGISSLLLSLLAQGGSKGRVPDGRVGDIRVGRQRGPPGRGGHDGGIGGDGRG